MCVETDDLRVYGDFNTFKARQLQIQLKKCQGEGCKSDEEITKFFKNKFLLLHANQIRFDSEGFFKNAAVKESRVQWLTINTQVKQNLPYAISTMDLELQDNKLLSFDELTRDDIESVFRLDGLPITSYERADESVQVSITLERSMNLTVVSRDVYTLLDWFSDIGGIQGIFISLIGLFLGVWNYNNMSNFLAS